MFGKILLTLAVILGAYWFLRRQRSPRSQVFLLQPKPAPRWVRTLAYALLGIFLATSLLWLYEDWAADREILQVEVINANTGAITRYQARRGDIQGRQFKTLDGRRVTLAEIERMILQPEDSP